MDLKSFLSQDMTPYQSIPFWSWNDHLEPSELRRQIRDMKRAGIGGFFMHARGGLTMPYLGEAWMEATAACIDEAEKQHMDAWCYDENGWPSGFAGMKLLEDERNWAHYLTCERKNAYDQTALAVYVLNENQLERVHAPRKNAGEYISVYEKTNSSVVDILNPAIVRKFLDETHEKYYARFEQDFGRVLRGFFTDEPQYFRWDTAYTPLVREEYQAVYGEDLLDGLGALFVDCAQASRFRFRYWKLMNVLYTVHFAQQIFDWCDAHHCQLTGHTIDETSLFGQVMCCAGVMPFYQYEHKPGIDWLGRNIASEITPRQVSSVAQQLGKKQVITETFACAGWDVTPRELKHIAEWQYVHGVNQMCQHLYPYSIRGQRKRDYPAFYSPHNPWAQPEEFKCFNDYFTRLGCLLSESREAADVAVIHPLHSAYLTFRRQDPHSCDTLNQTFTDLVEKLGQAGIGHHYVDETLLAQHGQVKGNLLFVGQCAYRFVVIPEMDNLDASTVALLRLFLRNGGRLYLQGKAPRLMDGEETNLSFLQSNASWAELMPEEYRMEQTGAHIRCTFRHGPFGRFLYAVNLSMEESAAAIFRFPDRGIKALDLETKKEQALHFDVTDDGIAVPLVFAPGESRVLFLDDSAAAAQPFSLPAVPRMLPLDGEILSKDENTLTLDTAALSEDGTHYTEPLPVMAISDRLLRGKQNRTIFLKYAFTLGEVPPSIGLECEEMGMKHCWVNGRELFPVGPGTLDRAFLRADLREWVHPGRNELIFQIDYQQPQRVYDIFNGVYYEGSDGTESLLNCLSYQTDIEAIYLRGDFSVLAPEMVPGPRNTRLTPGGFLICAPRTRLRADRLPEAGYPFFGGKLTLRIPFQADGNEKCLRLEGRYALARIRINHGAEQTLLFRNQLDVSGQIQAGENTLEITLYSSCRNMFGPFHFAEDPEPYGVSPDLFSGYGSWRPDGTSPHYTAAYALTFFGLKALQLF